MVQASIPKKNSVICADIGGTSARVGLTYTHRGEIILDHFYSLPTRVISSMSQLFGPLLKYCADQDIFPKTACIGVAGTVRSQDNHILLTNSSLTFSRRQLQRLLRCRMYVCNDFVLQGYAVSALPLKYLKCFKKGTMETKGTKAVIGAGTGLGKTILGWCHDCYVPLPSEGAHADFPPNTREEYELVKFLNHTLRLQASYENLVSGRGLAHIEKYVAQLHRMRASSSTQTVSWKALSSEDLFDKTVTSLFKRCYAKAARNFALEVYATGGVYLTGGFIQKHPSLCDGEFIREFVCHPSYARMLNTIPIYGIMNSNAGLYGACGYVLEVDT